MRIRLGQQGLLRSVGSYRTVSQPIPRGGLHLRLLLVIRPFQTVIVGRRAEAHAHVCFHGLNDQRILRQSGRIDPCNPQILIRRIDQGLDLGIVSVGTDPQRQL